MNEFSKMKWVGFVGLYYKRILRGLSLSLSEPFSFFSTTHFLDRSVVNQMAFCIDQLIN